MKKIIFPLLIILMNFTSCSSQDQMEQIQISIKDTVLSVEIADTEELREKGLMYRSGLDKKAGMLFIFEKEKKVSFWMKNTEIPLSVAYINKKGVIREIHDLTPFSLNPVFSSYSVLYVLEVNQGFFRENGIVTGDRISFPDSFPSE